MEIKTGKMVNGNLEVWEATEDGWISTGQTIVFNIPIENPNNYWAYSALIDGTWQFLCYGSKINTE